MSRGRYPCGLTLSLGGGSQMLVKPALAIMLACSFSVCSAAASILQQSHRAVQLQMLVKPALSIMLACSLSVCSTAASMHQHPVHMGPYY